MENEVLKQEAVDEVEKALKAISKKKANAPYFRHHIKVPVLRKRGKASFSFAQQATQDQLLNYWDHIWKTTSSFEAMSLALYAYQHKSLSKKEFLKIKTWIKKCNCWEHSDDLSKIYAQVLEEHPEWILNDLKKWNSSKSSWERRQSVVSLLEYSSKRKKHLPFPQMIAFVQNLLEDDEYYVQKGVGWTLREIYNLYPKKTLSFIEKNLSNLSPMAYSTSTEKVDREIKKELNAKRKKHRSQKDKS